MGVVTVSGGRAARKASSGTRAKRHAAGRGGGGGRGATSTVHGSGRLPLVMEPPFELPAVETRGVRGVSPRGVLASPALCWKGVPVFQLSDLLGR